MKSKLALFSFLFMAFTSACSHAVSTEPSGAPGDLDTECPEPADTEDWDHEECSVPVSVTACAVTYPECAPDQPYVRFLTHGSHDCDAPYPPKFCEYVGDVTCDGVTAGVWCCE